MWPLPPETARTVRPFSGTGPTCPGVSSSPTSEVPPRPSWPAEPKPQQTSAPSSRITQVWKSPAEMATARRPAPMSTAPAAAGASLSPIVAWLP